jgi:lipid-A-disaccharide synthase
MKALNMLSDRTYKIFISAAEPSADAHCAGLINALRKSGLNIEFTGLGGAKMESAGCNLIEDTASGAVMGAAAFGQVGRYIKLINKTKKFLQKEKPDLVVVCDSPAFNFHIAKAAKRVRLRRIKTLFYVAPQLWAWGGWRIKKLRKYCDKLCCILPFEQDWFSQKGIDTTFVGNPLLDEVGPDLSANIKDYRNFQPQKTKIVILPGSRAAEIETLWPAMQQIARRLKQKYPSLTINVVAVDEQTLSALKSKRLAGFDCQYSVGDCFEAARRADFAIVASGSATLQVAAAGCPMVVMYQSSKLLWHLAGKFIVKTKHLSLVNILAEKELVPEFMPFFSSIEPVVTAIEQLLEDKKKLAETSRELIKLTEPMAAKNAAQKVGEIVVGMLENMSIKN